MDFFGFSLWHDLITGDKKWTDSLELGDPREFDIEEDGWKLVFSRLQQVLHDSGLKNGLGACFHTSSRIPGIISDPAFDIYEPFKLARDDFKKRIPFEFGMHSTFGLQDLPLSGYYPGVLAEDIRLATKLGATCIVGHPPKDKKVCIRPFVDELTSNQVVDTLKSTSITLNWENMGPNNFFGSLKSLLEFHDALSDKLREIGYEGLIKQHQFCLDTGHLLLWRHQVKLGLKKAQKEIEQYLPDFAKNLKSYHIHSNDGTSDNHIIPGSLEFFDHPSRKGINKKRFLKHSEDVMDFLKTCDEYKGIEGRHVHLEALKLPFSLNQVIEFGRKYKELIKL
ncbi:MAG: TIM barrel protein [Candidatus Hodarchaeota archaeon]